MSSNSQVVQVCTFLAGRKKAAVERPEGKKMSWSRVEGLFDFVQRYVFFDATSPIDPRQTVRGAETGHFLLKFKTGLVGKAVLEHIERLIPGIPQEEQEVLLIAIEVCGEQFAPVILV